MKTYNKNQITVIVPVYNVEEYLDRCVESIISQTLANFDLILVDDGSPDKCPEACDKWAKRDKRINVIHQENSGLSSARNAGIDWAINNSESQWITFVDSDDWLLPNAFSELLNAVKSNHCEISLCGYQSTNGISVKNSEDINSSLWSPQDFFVKDRVNAIVAWGKLYKKDLFLNRRFPVGRLHEDEFLIPELLFSQTDIAVISAPLYCYFNNSSGITGNKKRVYFDKLDALEQQLSFFVQNGFTKAEMHVLPLLAEFLIRYFGDTSRETRQNIFAAQKIATRLINKYKTKLSITQKEQLQKYTNIENI